jgi:hypothetical protein
MSKRVHSTSNTHLQQPTQALRLDAAAAVERQLTQPLATAAAASTFTPAPCSFPTQLLQAVAVTQKRTPAHEHGDDDHMKHLEKVETH